MFALANANEFAFLLALAFFFVGDVPITNRMSSIEARGGQARMVSRGEIQRRRGAATTDDGRHPLIELM